MAWAIRWQCLHYMILMSTVILPTALAASASASSNVPQSDCRDTCGNVTIPYPFGTGPGCYRDSTFLITCNDSTEPPKAFLGKKSTIQLIDINITSGEARTYKRITYRCYNDTNSTYNSNRGNISLGSGLYLFSNTRNMFTAVGCYNLAYIVGEGKTSDLYQSGCVTFCEGLNSTTGDGGSCNGLGCCQTAIPAGLYYYEVNWGFTQNPAWDFNPCNYAVLVEEQWYKFQVSDLSGENFLSRTDGKRVNIILDWAIRANGTCLDSGMENSTYPACLSENSKCYNTSNGVGYLCNCSQGYEGNPYTNTAQGCTDINECEHPNEYPCKGDCKNTAGGYECSCPNGKRLDPTSGCVDKFPRSALIAIVSIATVGVLVGLFFLVVTYKQQKKYREQTKEYQRYYGMMDNQLRVFSRRQIEIATDYYNKTHEIGSGGQGNVYKGFLENNQVVAIKKAREVEETQRGEFVNEILLLSQLNHKNIVRLLGCCLESKIPMLVYEFVPNGTLFELLHRKSSRIPISLGTRLKISLESAIALDYIHSSISNSIIHGDVKSANILLDTDYTAKISDFGASSVVPVNEIVELVHFSHGYLDPECLYTQILTKNSDVYSFGVVMLELITGKEAIYLDENGEKQPLATCFLLKVRKNEHREMLALEIASTDEIVVVIVDEICELAVQCLSPKGEDRPTMRHVAEELQKLVRFFDRSASRKLDEEEMESLLGDTKLPSISDASGFSTTQYSAVLQMEAGAPR